MKVLPVIDILNGQVVHAVRGERSRYKPIQSVLTRSAAPVEVAAALKAAGFKEIYMADLDAILDCTSHSFDLLRKISRKTGLSLTVDAGVTSVERAQLLLDAGASKIVVGTETLQTKAFIKGAIERFGSKRVIVSLDLKEEKVLVAKGFEGCTNALCMLQEFKTMGLCEVIVLDLSRVGSSLGVDMDFLKQAKSVGLDVYAGGGVRNIPDLIELHGSGISGALVATALHTGKISVAELKTAGFL